MTRALGFLGGLAFLVVAAVPATALAQGAGAAQTAQVPQPPPAPPPPPLVKVGEPMPDFSLNYLEPGPDGGRPSSKTVKLSDFKGKQVVVLAFFPAAFSPG